MKKCKIKSFKKIGMQMTYNVTMKSDHHNYAIYDKTTGSSVISLNSHAAAYAFLAYQTAWLKAYYPVEFMCNLLTSEINNEDKLFPYLAQAETMGIVCQKPDINQSGLEFKIQVATFANDKKKDVLRKPLTSLKGVGFKAVQNIVENQPYKNLEEFLSKIESRIVNSRVFETLVKSGCMEEAWDQPKEYLLKQYAEVKKKIDIAKKEKVKQDKKKEQFKGKTLFDEFDYSGSSLQI